MSASTEDQMSLSQEIARILFALTALILVALLTTPPILSASDEIKNSTIDGNNTEPNSLTEKKPKKSTKSRRAS